MNSRISALILNADDYGLTTDTNRAISELAALGALSSTSLMTNLPNVSQAAELLRYRNLGIGVHINLTTGKPITNNRSLVDANGTFLTLRQLIPRMRQIDIQEARAEIEAQVSRARELVGDRLDHWDSHEGIHRYEPFATLSISVACALGVPGMRGHRHYFVKRAHPLRAEQPSIRYGFKRMLHEAYYTMLTIRGRKHFVIPKGLLSLQQGKTLDVLHLLAECGSPAGMMTWELPCHPASSEVGLTDDERKIPRVIEYEFLKSPSWLSAIHRGSVRLTTFGELRKA